MPDTDADGDDGAIILLVFLSHSDNYGAPFRYVFRVQTLVELRLVVARPFLGIVAGDVVATQSGTYAHLSLCFAAADLSLQVFCLPGTSYGPVVPFQACQEGLPLGVVRRLSFLRQHRRPLHRHLH